MTPKVFCIGFHKTGTKSLGAALRELGYKVTGPNGTRDPDIERNVHSMAYRLAEQYDAFQDNPWPLLYREMDERYPNSKFILTLRAPEQWIRSQVAHFGATGTPMRQWIYGAACPAGNEELYVARFQRHKQEVLSYFRERPRDLLVMDLAQGDGWEKLCAFLEREAIDSPFPHANRAEDRGNRSAVGSLRRFVKRAIR